MCAITTRSEVSGDSLFYEALIRSYVKTPHFVERRWLEEQIQAALDDPACRLLLLTAEPGAGKSALLAWLADCHSNWPRYFIRRDQRTLLGDVGAHSLLLQIGFQLAAIFPQLFSQEQVKVVIEQRLGHLSASGELVAAEINKIFASPFYQQVVQIRQEVECNDGSMVGIRIDEWVTDPRLMPLSDLQYLALLDPAHALMREDPRARIVILIDALDELHYYGAQESILSWLANCPPLPDNVRFVFASRPDDDLLRVLRSKQKAQLRDFHLDVSEPSISDTIKHDLAVYAASFTTEQSIREALVDQGIEPDNFAARAATKAEGNFLYLATLRRGIEQAIATGQGELLSRLMRLEEVPAGLGELYAFFLELVREIVGEDKMEIPGPTPFEVDRVPMWPGLYQPILGVLAIAREPLDLQQIKNLGGIQAEDRWLREALGHLEQFLDQDAGVYRLYHSTFPEFITSPTTQISHPACYLAPLEWHQKIVAYYRGKASTWENVTWNRVDDYGMYHLAVHLVILIDLEAAAERDGSVRFYRNELYELICKSFIREKRTRFGSYSSFADDVALAVEVARAEDPANLPQVIRTSLIYATVSSLVTKVPPNVLGISAAIGQIKKALELASLIQDREDQCEAYRLIGKALLERGDDAGARAVLLEALMAVDLINDQVERADALGSLAPMLAKVSELRRVEIEIEKIEDKWSRARALTGMVRAMVQIGTFDRASSLAESIEDAYCQAVALNEITQAMAQLDEAEAVDVAIRVLDAAFGDEAWSRPMSMSEAAKALASVGALDLAWEAVGEIERGHSQLEEELGDESQFSNRSDELTEFMDEISRTSTLGIWEHVKEQAVVGIVKSASQVGLFDQAVEAFEKIEDQDSQAMALSWIAEALSKREARVGAEKLAHLAIVAARDIKNCHRKAEVLSRASQVLALSGNVDQAMGQAEIIRDLDDDTNIPYLYRTVPTAAKGFKGQELHDAFRKVLWKPLAFLKIAPSLHQMGEHESALEIVDWALRIVDSIQEYLYAKAYALGEVAQVLQEVNEQEKAAEIVSRAILSVETVEDQEAFVKALCSIGLVLAQMGEQKKACEIAERSLRVTERIGEWHKKAQALANIAQVLARTAQLHRLRRAIGLIEDEHARLSALEKISQALAQIHMFKRALDIVELIKSPVYEAEALLDIAECLGKSSKRKRAVELVNRAHSLINASENYYWAPGALSRTAEILAQIGKFEQALEIADEIGYIPMKAYALSRIAQAMVQQGMLDRAQNLIAAIEDEHLKTDAANRLAQAQALVLAQKGAFEQSLIIAQGIEDEMARTDTLKRLVETFGQLGAYERALKTAKFIENERIKIEALNAAAQALEQRGQHEQALLCWNTALASAQMAGRQNMLNTIAAGAPIIAAINGGKALWTIYEAIVEVESWWSIQ